MQLQSALRLMPNCRERECIITVRMPYYSLVVCARRVGSRQCKGVEQGVVDFQRGEHHLRRNARAPLGESHKVAEEHGDVRMEVGAGAMVGTAGAPLTSFHRGEFRGVLTEPLSSRLLARGTMLIGNKRERLLTPFPDSSLDWLGRIGSEMHVGRLPAP